MSRKHRHVDLRGGQKIIAKDREHSLYLEAKRDIRNITKQTRESNIHFKCHLCPVNENYNGRYLPSQKIKTVSTIQRDGSRPWPKLKVGDIVLAKASCTSATIPEDCYVSAVVTKLPSKNDDNHPHRYGVRSLFQPRQGTRIEIKESLTRYEMEKLPETRWKNRRVKRKHLPPLSLAPKRKKPDVRKPKHKTAEKGTQATPLKITNSVVSRISQLVQELLTDIPDFPKENKIPSVWIGREVLARWVDDGWYYWSTVTKRKYNEGLTRWLIEDIAGLKQWTTEEDILTDDHLTQVQVKDSVIALHPDYTNSYAPGIVRKVFASGDIDVVFYNEVITTLTPDLAYKISSSKYKDVKENIVKMERQVCGQEVIARDDTTGIFHKAKVIEMTDRYQNYKIKWNLKKRSETIVSATQIFLYPQQNQTGDIDKWEYLLAEDSKGDFLPGTYSKKKVLLCDSTWFTVRNPSENCIWLSKDYFCNAVNFYYSKNPGKLRLFTDQLERGSKN